MNMQNAGSMVMPALQMNKQETDVVTLEQGVARMAKDWREKLWFEFKRDWSTNKDLMRLVGRNIDATFEELLNGDVDELRLDKHTCTEEYLKEIHKYIRDFDKARLKTPLMKLEIAKVLLTGPKARMLAKILALPNCEISDLILNKCRAKSDKMGLIFSALAKNHSVANLSLKGTNIPRDSLTSLVDMLGSSRTLRMLTLFNAGLSENAIMTLAPGFEQNHNIIYLDLRQNTFENEGFQKLATSLTGQPSLMTLRINGMHMGAEEVRILQQLLCHSNCRIQNLEMEELEVFDDKSAEVIEAVSTLKRLFTFDFSNNTLQPQMNESIVRMINKYPELEILCLDHCEMTDTMCRTYFDNMQNTNLQFLNVSWNQITESSLEYLVKVVNQNQGLEKLALQHNRLGNSDLSPFSQAIASHKSLKYLDISANNIGNFEFIKIFMAIQSRDSKVSTFHCRKNRIGGNKIDHVLLCQSRILKVLDLTSNRLSEHNGRTLLKYAKQNVTIEKLLIDQNFHVSAQVLKDIGEECRQNVLIKKKIIKYLPLKTQEPGQISSSRSLADQPCQMYDVSELCLHDQKLNYVDFIQKFIRWNQDCKTLKLCNVDLSLVQDKIKDVFDPQLMNRTNFNLQTLHIENSQMCNKTMRRFLRSLRSMHSLKNLHLVDLDELENLMDVLTESISKLQHLEVLDVRNTKLRTRDVSVLVPLLTKNRVVSEIDISNAIISKKNMLHLWMALHYNIQVCKLTYSRINFMALDEIMALDAELQMNCTIRDQIKPLVESRSQKLQVFGDVSSKDIVSLRNFEFSQQTNPAVIKYIKSQKDTMRSLDLSCTNLRTTDMNYLIKEITDPSSGIRLKTLNLSQNQTVSDDVIKLVCHLLKASASMENLLFDSTKVTMTGLKTVLKAVESSRNIRTISVKDNELLFTGRDAQEVVELLMNNFSITEFRYQDNYYNAEFVNSVRQELDLNSKIVKNIFPQLKDQEEKARKEKIEQKKRQKEDLKRKARMKAREDRLMSTSSKKHFKKSTSKKLLFLEGPIEVDEQERLANSFTAMSPDNVASRSKNDRAMHLDLISAISSKTSDQSRFKNLRSFTLNSNHPDLVFEEFDQNNPGQGGILRPEHQVRRLNNSHDDLSDQGSHINASSDSVSASSARSDGSSQRRNQSDILSMADTPTQIEGGFKLSLCNNNLSELGIAFVTKFTRIFRTINEIDFGKNKNMGEVEIAQFGAELKLNKYIQKVCIQKKGMSKNQDRIIAQEIAKNKAIYELNRTMAHTLDNKMLTSLDLADRQLRDFSFLPKMIQEFKNLQELDLSNSDLRQTSAVEQLCNMIDENQTIQRLILQNCNINAKTLNMIADALTQIKNSNLLLLNIRKNPIQDPQYKVLYGLLMCNQSIEEILYTLYEEENLQKLKEFQELMDAGADSIVASQKMREKANAHHHLHIPLWQKLCFPIWCWKSMIHDKHEAFRFKYDTSSIKKVERDMMPTVKRQLYCWSIIYYLIVFAAPYIFIEHECYKTFSDWLFVLYGSYAFFCAIWEIYVVIKIQHALEKHSLLKFNKWHVVELFMGMIARTDTFLDICFVHIIANCWDEYEPWVIPSLSFAVMNLIFPFVMLLYLLLKPYKVGNSLYQPYLEDTCFAAFIRENMLLATVLDSFCINNSFYFFGRPLVFGKLMGFISFFTQDCPQLTIHVLFKLLIISESQKKLKTQSLLLIGMICSSMAVLISIFNMVMCAQNEFDPIVLEAEMMRRKEKIRDEKQLKIKELQPSKKLIVKEQINTFKQEILNWYSRHSDMNSHGNSHPQAAFSLQSQWTQKVGQNNDDQDVFNQVFDENQGRPGLLVNSTPSSALSNEKRIRRPSQKKLGSKAYSLQVDNHGDQFARKQELIPNIVAEIDSIEEESVDQDANFGNRPSILKIAKKRFNEEKQQTAGMKENEKMTGYLDYLGENANNRHDKIHEAAQSEEDDDQDVKNLMQKLPVNGQRLSSRQQNFLSVPSDHLETAEPQKEQNWYDSQPAQVRFHPPSQVKLSQKFDLDAIEDDEFDPELLLSKRSFGGKNIQQLNEHSGSLLSLPKRKLSSQILPLDLQEDEYAVEMEITPVHPVQQLDVLLETQKYLEEDSIVRGDREGAAGSGQEAAVQAQNRWQSLAARLSEEGVKEEEKASPSPLKGNASNFACLDVSPTGLGLFNSNGLLVSAGPQKTLPNGLRQVLGAAEDADGASFEPRILDEPGIVAELLAMNVNDKEKEEEEESKKKMK